MEAMFKFVIRYQFGPYSGTHTVFCNTDDSDVAIARMWRDLGPTLVMAYRSARVISCEEIE